jgi:hypothetical protein
MKGWYSLKGRHDHPQRWEYFLTPSAAGCKQFRD